MSQFKFLPYTLKTSEFYDPIYLNKWFERWHSCLWNPFGNKHEPGPYPDAKQLDAQRSKLNKHIWWFLRNPFHNITHFLLGITANGEYLEWITPEEDGWRLEDGYYIRGDERRKKFTGRGYGVQSRGNFRISTGNKRVDGIVLLAALVFIIYAIAAVV